MKKNIFILITQFLFFQFISAQVFYAKEFSKDISLYKAKSYVINELFGSSDKVIKFEIDPLAASSSGELTSLVYNCEELNKEGLLLGFYGDYWNDSGVVYQGYGFKNLTKEKSLELLQKIEDAKSKFNNYLAKDTDNNNIYFSFDDLTILIYKTSETKIRIFWNTFDAEWQDIAFRRTKKRFEKKIN